MKTELCDLLNIEYPIIQGAMAHITDGKFAAAVSNAGGLGVIQCGFDTPEYMREEIRTARSLTDKPFAVNLIMENNRIDEIAALKKACRFARFLPETPRPSFPSSQKQASKQLFLCPTLARPRKWKNLELRQLFAKESRAVATSDQ